MIIYPCIPNKQTMLSLLLPYITLCNCDKAMGPYFKEIPTAIYFKCWYLYYLGKYTDIILAKTLWYFTHVIHVML